MVAEAICDFFDEPHNVKALNRLLAWLDVQDMAAPAPHLAGLRQDSSLHRHAGKDDKAGSQGRGPRRWGAKVSGSVSAKTDIVVAGPGAGQQAERRAKAWRRDYG